MDSGFRISDFGLNAAGISPVRNPQSAIRNRFAFTLVEMLVVMALLGALASTIAVVLIQARRVSIRVECQGRMREIGATLKSIALTNGGKYPDVLDANGYPWWAKAFDQWRGGASGSLDVGNDPADGLQIPAQLPADMKVFHCRMGGALQNDGTAAGLFDSISYGILFDVRLAPANPGELGLPYECTPGTNQLTAATSSPDADDMEPDGFYISEIKDAARFILLSEADTQDPDPANWTGGRLTMGAVDRASASSFAENAPVVGRHDGYANVLFADMHIDVLEVAPDYPTSQDRNVNADTPLWTLPAD